MQFHQHPNSSVLGIIALLCAGLAFCEQGKNSENTLAESPTSTICPAKGAVESLCRQPSGKCNDAPINKALKCPTCSESCLIPTVEVGSMPIDSEDLPSAFYDALDNPISEDEYWRQVEYEDKHGLPFTRDRAAEQANLDKPISLLTYSSLSCQGDPDKRMTERSKCYNSPHGHTIFVESFPSNCEVVVFLDGACTEEPFTALPMFGMKYGCLSTDTFGSVRVDCRPLPE